MLTDDQICKTLCSYVKNYGYGLSGCNGTPVYDAMRQLFKKRFGFTYDCGWVCPDGITILEPPIIDPPIDEYSCIDLTIQEESDKECNLPNIKILT